VGAAARRCARIVPVIGPPRTTGAHRAPEQRSIPSGTSVERIAKTTDPALIVAGLHDAASSVFHQRHSGRVLRSSCDSRDEELHRHVVENLDQADALLLGRMTGEMMEQRFATGAYGTEA
jgi:hypothetical protein